jgi:phage-related protein
MRYGTARPEKTLHAAFYRNEAGQQPVRDWLMGLLRDDRRRIGEDIATLEYSWPIGKPKCAPIAGTKGMFEVRSNLHDGQIARVLFTISGNHMVLLHAFVKKSRKTPRHELGVAVSRMKDLKRHER